MCVTQEWFISLCQVISVYATRLNSWMADYCITVSHDCKKQHASTDPLATVDPSIVGLVGLTSFILMH